MYFMSKRVSLSRFTSKLINVWDFQGIISRVARESIDENCTLFYNIDEQRKIKEGIMCKEKSMVENEDPIDLQ